MTVVLSGRAGLALTSSGGGQYGFPDRLAAWFVDEAGRDRTYREVRRFDEPRLDLDHVADAVEDLAG